MINPLLIINCCIPNIDYCIAQVYKFLMQCKILRFLISLFCIIEWTVDSVCINLAILESSRCFLVLYCRC